MTAALPKTFYCLIDSQKMHILLEFRFFCTLNNMAAT
jgi:hypothetical protein